MRTLAQRAASLVAAVAVLAGPASPAAAEPVPHPGTGSTTSATVPHPGTGGSADFSVSTSAEPVSPDADGVVRTQLTIANNGSHPLAVKVRSVRVRPLDDGQAELTDRSDPTWSPGVTVTPSLQLAAHSYRSVPVVITVPPTVLPDIYLLGFVAEAQPVEPSAAVRIYHRIGALVSLQLAGARQRHLTLSVQPNRFITIGSTFDGAYDMVNVGEAAAMARDQVALDNELTHEGVATVHTGDGMRLLPAGTARHVEFHYRVRGFFLYARPQAQVMYGNGTGTLQTLTAGGDALLVIPWLTLILLGLVALVLTAYLVWLRRRRAARRRAAELTGGRHRAKGRRPRDDDRTETAWAG
ncbi:hypothetical protein GCM10010172_56330 [Paractinoplanes ferrugineus]|uniref:DUF916 domain-containing protein n=1 Tax=Paractinoplanes ferrugineus TaxID=113564 RepID=A0A919J5D1_9ACTN|nr:hypothetical protein [Actinoplanes ferrugineus]GIE10896.1 hypothetical protein Afe05nite_27360 [Actinoplanes ferrugineus]